MPASKAVNEKPLAIPGQGGPTFSGEASGSSGEAAEYGEGVK